MFGFADAPRRVAGSSVGLVPRNLAFSPCGLRLLVTTEGGRAAAHDVPPHTFVDGAEGAAAEVEEDDAAQSVAARRRPPPTHALPPPRTLVTEGAALRDAAWWPGMRADQPTSALFATACKDQPVHLWDALTGDLRASYVGVDHRDAVVGAHALAFSPDGASLVVGCDRLLLRYDAARPGREAARWLTTPQRRSREGQRGLLSSVAFGASDVSTFAVGSFDGSVWEYDAGSGRGTAEYVEDGVDGEVVGPPPPGGAAAAGAAAASGAEDDDFAAVYAAGGSNAGGARRQLKRRRVAGAAGAADAASPATPAARRRGVSQVAIDGSGFYLLVGQRQSGHIVCWDRRYPSAPVYRFARDGGTHQRLQFAVDGAGAYLLAGGRDGVVHVYDVSRGQHVRSQGGHGDAVAAVALHPCGVAYAVATGQRHARPDGDEHDDGARGCGGSGEDGEGGNAAAAARPSLPPPPQPSVAVWRTIVRQSSATYDGGVGGEDDEVGS